MYDIGNLTKHQLIMLTASATLIIATLLASTWAVLGANAWHIVLMLIAGIFMFFSKFVIALKTGK
jgi:hypothetical protein